MFNKYKENKVKEWFDTVMSLLKTVTNALKQQDVINKDFNKRLEDIEDYLHSKDSKKC